MRTPFSWFIDQDRISVRYVSNGNIRFNTGKHFRYVLTYVRMRRECCWSSVYLESYVVFGKNVWVGIARRSLFISLYKNNKLRRNVALIDFFLSTRQRVDQRRRFLRPTNFFFFFIATRNKIYIYIYLCIMLRLPIACQKN